MSEPRFVTTSERLGFRLLEDADLDDLVKLDTDPEVRAFFPEGALSPAQIRERIARNRAMFERYGFADFAAIELDTGAFVGRAGFGRMDDGEVEVGYVFLKAHWGRGLAQESLRALLAWAEASLDLGRIVAYAPTEHEASLNVMRRCGMRYVETATARGTSCDFYEYPL